jgi:hypothetical protein
MLHKFTIAAAWTLVVVLAYGTLTNVQSVYTISHKIPQAGAIFDGAGDDQLRSF